MVHVNQLKSCHLTVMAEEGCEVSNILVAEDTIEQEPPWTSFQTSLWTQLVVLLNSIILLLILESPVSMMFRMSTTLGVTQHTPIRVQIVTAILSVTEPWTVSSFKGAEQL